MAAAEAMFPPDNPYGVLAFGFGRKIRSGRTSRTRCLNVYVLQKHVAPERPVPPVVVESAGLTLRPDVIGVGVPPRPHDGDAIAPPMTGLYPGAAILVRGRVSEFGGVACVLGDAGGPTHVLTAGHLFPSGQPGVEVLGARRGGPRVVVGNLVANLLDQPFPSMTFPIDAALVALTFDGVQIASASTEGPRIADVLDGDAMRGIAVMAFLPTSHDFSHGTTTLDGPVTVHMSAAARGTYTVRQALGTHAAVTNDGDSGTIFFNGHSDSALVAGLCVGEFGPMSVCEPFVRALTILREGTGLQLQPM
jgi:hypothetical protein